MACSWWAGWSSWSEAANYSCERAPGLAARVGLSSLVIGLTVLAFSTSSPELAVTLGAVLEGNPTWRSAT